jgi:hypothetical protein
VRSLRIQLFETRNLTAVHAEIVDVNAWSRKQEFWYWFLQYCGRYISCFELLHKSQSSAHFMDCLVSFLSEKPSITYLNFGYCFLLLVLVLNCAQDVSYHVCLCSYLLKYVGQIMKG